MADTNGKEAKKDRHASKWHTQVRDIPPEVWARVRAAATARYVEVNGRMRPLNVGEYITRCVVLAERVRDAAESSDTNDEFTKKVLAALKELGLEAVYT